MLPPHDRPFFALVLTTVMVRLRFVAAALALALLGGLVAAAPATAAPSTLTLTKTASATEVRPGEQFGYTLTVGCSGLTEGCVNATVTDTLPSEFDVSSLPPSSSERTVTYDAVTRLLTVVYRIPLNQPAGSNGLPAGASKTISVGMRLPSETAVTDGQVIPNSASANADNADNASASVDITAIVPVTYRPVATKTWSPSTAIAQSDEDTVVVLGVRNASSTSASVSTLTVSDTTAATFNSFDVTSLGPVAAYPPGADEVTISVCTKPVATPCVGIEWISETHTGSGPWLPPAGVNFDAITGLQVTYSNSSNQPIPYSADAGRIAVGLRLRDTNRSTALPIQPQSPQTITNRAEPSLIATDTTEVAGTVVTAPFVIQPDAITTSATKKIYPDNAGNWTTNGFVVLGQDSGVSMNLTAGNTSAVPVNTLVIDEPSQVSPSEFAKIDVTKGKFTWPAGATNATLEVTCRTGTSPAPVQFVRTATPNPVISSMGCEAGSAPSQVRLTYTGTSGTGRGTIEPKASAILYLHGVAAGVDAGDVSDGLRNCVGVTATAPPAAASASEACSTVSVEDPSPGLGSGYKTGFGVTTIVPGQPMRFEMGVTNSGNVPLTYAYVVDPPDPTASPNPFDSVFLTRITTSATPASVIELWDPTPSTGLPRYVTYTAPNNTLLHRATGFRVRLTAPLPLKATFRVYIDVDVRAATPLGTQFTNCASFGSYSTADPFNGSILNGPHCADPVEVAGASAGASLAKQVAPTSVLRPEPGLPAADSTTTIKHRVQNSGTLYLKRLQIVDTDVDFWDSVNLVSPGGKIRVNFPRGANRVTIDVCTTDCTGPTWIPGTATSSATPGLPGGVAAADVRGIRVTFTSSSNGYVLTPTPNFPVSGACTNASVCFDVVAREFLRGTSTPIPATVTNTSSGAGESKLQTPGTTFPIPDASADLSVVEGTASIALSKGPDSRIGPGDTAPFDLTIENTGTTAIVNPVITDPLPAELTLEESAPGGSPGRPFVITYPALPSGYAPPASVDYVATPDGVDPNRTAAVTWTFTGWNLPPGGKVTIRFYVRLTPGTPAAVTTTNTAGAHGDNSSLTCDPSTTPVTDDPLYGTGLYCLASASVVSLEGNAVDAQKWSASSVDLGFVIVSTGEVVPSMDPRCPDYRINGRVYTRFPCAPIVPPGGEIYFAARLVNAGTNNLVRAVLVDGLPVQGDTGVLLSGSQRGTQWSTRPTMLTPVTQLEGHAGVTTGYTDNTFPGASFCTANLTGGSCPPTAFADSLSTTTTGFRTLMDFPLDAPLRPGQGVTLTWTMQAPLTLATALNSPVAWNSFAQKSYFTTGELPATEPPKAGAAMRFNQVTVSKVVIGIPPDVTLPSFDMGYRCVLDNVEVSSGTVNVTDGDSAALPYAPVGAQCSVWEITTNGGSSPNQGEADAVVVTVPDPTENPDGVAVPITNSFQSGLLTITKAATGGAALMAVDGGGTLGDREYSLAVECSFPSGASALPGFPDYPLIGAGDTLVYGAQTGWSLPAGSDCTVTELDSGGATRTLITADGGSAHVTDTATVSVLDISDGGSLVAIDNEFDAGEITLTKTVSGDASSFAQGPFEFSVECTLAGVDLAPIPVTLTIGSLTTTVTPLPVGAACAVYETDGADSATTTPTLIANIVVPSDTDPPVTVSADNAYPAGYVTVSKSVQGNAARLVRAATYSLRVQCTQSLLGGGSRTVLDTTVSVVPGSPKLITSAVPIGSVCWATEPRNGGATTTVIDYPDANNGVTVTSGTPNVSISATNTFDEGTVIVAKRTTGTPPAGATYPFRVACTMPVTTGSQSYYSVGLIQSNRSFSLAASQQRSIAVPVGATCRVVEDNSRGATVTYSESNGGSGSRSDGVVVVGAATAATVTVTNAFTACRLNVSALSPNTSLPRQGAVTVVSQATTSSNCELLVRPPTRYGSKVVCSVSTVSRAGDLTYCRYAINRAGRVVVTLAGYAGVQVKATLIAVPKAGVTGVKSTSWTRTWRVR